MLTALAGLFLASIRDFHGQHVAVGGDDLFYLEKRSQIVGVQETCSTLVKAHHDYS